MFINDLYLIAFFATVVVPLIFLIVTVFAYKQYIYSLRRKKSFEGKVALVTGSGNGLGKSICLALAKEKCHLICVDIDDINNKATVEQIKAITNNSIKVIGIKCDVTDPDNVDRMLKIIYRRFDSLDILINNAGVAYPARILNLTNEHIKHTINVNLLAHFWVSFIAPNEYTVSDYICLRLKTIRTFIPRMIDRQKGQIVAIASFVSDIGFECLSPYCASKYGVRGLMESLAHELNIMKHNIDLLTVHPGFLATRLLPSQYSKNGVYFLRNSFPFHVMSTKYVAEQIIVAMKEKRRNLFVPYYNKLLIEFLRIIPQLIGDFLKVNFGQVEPHLDPLTKVN